MTSNDLWPPWKTLGIIYLPRATNILSLKFRQLSRIEIMCLQGFQSFTSGDLKWPLTSIENNRKSSTHQGLSTYQVWSSGNFQLLRYRVYKVFSLLPLVTSIDLWPPWKTIGIIYPPRAINIPSLKFQQLSLIEITVFTRFSDFDLWWPHMTFDLHGKQ